MKAKPVRPGCDPSPGCETKTLISRKRSASTSTAMARTGWCSSLAGEPHAGARQAVDRDLEGARLVGHVEDLQRVAVADRAVGQRHVERVAVGQDVDVEPVAGDER